MSAPTQGTGFGLRIDTDVAIPGLGAPVPQSTGDANIFVRRAILPDSDDDTADAPYRRTAAGLLFSAPGVGRFLARDGTHLAVDPAAGADAETVSALLVATALPMLLWQRGGLLLHAACVQWPGAPGAVAIAGRSGSGKSAIAARLVDEGAALVADDSCWLRPGATGVRVSGLPGGLFVRHGDGGRSFCAVAAARQRTEAPLAALIVLDGEGGFGQRLPRLAALEALLRHCHRPAIPAMLGGEAARFADCVLHSGHVAAYACGPKDGENTGSHHDIVDFVHRLSLTGNDDEQRALAAHRQLGGIAD